MWGAKQLKESLPSANSHAPELGALNKERCEGKRWIPAYKMPRGSNLQSAAMDHGPSHSTEQVTRVCKWSVGLTAKYLFSEVEIHTITINQVAEHNNAAILMIQLNFVGAQIELHHPTSWFN